MIKKALFLAAAAIFSANASAGYVQYDFANNSWGQGLSGYVIQHDDDQSIAFFNLRLNASDFGAYFSPFDGEGATEIVRADTFFKKDGPTNFVINDDFGLDHWTSLAVTLTPSTAGAYKYKAEYYANLYMNQPPFVTSGAITGFATTGVVDPVMAAYLDSMGGYEHGVYRIVPEYIPGVQVPEPASLALIAAGLLGAAGVSRRRASKGRA